VLKQSANLIAEYRMYIFWATFSLCTYSNRW